MRKNCKINLLYQTISKTKNIAKHLIELLSLSVSPFNKNKKNLEASYDANSRECEREREENEHKLTIRRNVKNKNQ